MTAYCYFNLFTLYKMDYFGDSSKPFQLDENKMFIGELLYHLLRGVEENSHEIVELQDTGPEYSGTLDSLYDGGDHVIRVIGSALNGVASLFNNSCDVNTIKVHSVSSSIQNPECKVTRFKTSFSGT